MFSDLQVAVVWRSACDRRIMAAISPHLSGPPHSGPECMTDTLYIVDVFSLMFQVFHGIPMMTSPDGLPTNAVFGFTRDLIGILRSETPSHLVCAMDSPGPGVRNDIYSEYKANREDLPEDLRPQIPMIADVMAGLRIPAIRYDGWEADDVVATLTRQAVESDMSVRIVSSDKDLRQLLGPRVQIFNVRKQQFLDADDLMREWGVRPDQVIDYQSLVGDSVDNVPGVPLVGPKKARDLLERFGTLEEVLAHADEAPGKKLRENLVTFAEQARVSRQLVTLRQDLPLAIDWDSARVNPPDHERLLELFNQYGFRRLADEMRSAAEQSADPAPAQQTLDVINTAESLESLLPLLRDQAQLAIHLAPDPTQSQQQPLCNWGLSWQTGHSVLIDAGPSSELEPQAVIDALRPLLEDDARTITGYAIKQQLRILESAGIHVTRIGVDPLIGDYLLDAGSRRRNLAQLAERYLQQRVGETSAAKTQLALFDDQPQPGEQLAESAELTLRLAHRIGELLEQNNLLSLYQDLERPLIPVLVSMETCGIRIDVEELQRQSAAVAQQLAGLEVEIHELAGHAFNIDSPRQLRTILFDELRLPVLKRTKTGPSTNHEVLEKLADMHPLPSKIIEHRQASKLKNTYLDALPALVNPATGRVHATFNQDVAATGRLSSSDPNLQNIPVRTAAGRLVRRAFVPRDPDWLLVCADYSQIELRMLAHFSEDPVLIAAFDAGEDIHTSVAAVVFGVAEADVDKDMRRVAKAVNFGVIYGQTGFGLASSLDIALEDAEQFIEDYFTRYARVAGFLDEVLDRCAETGYASTLSGRRRAISGIRAERGPQRNLPERTAINTVIQGSAADLIKQAMINIHGRLTAEQHPARMLLQIHDELVFEVPQEHLRDLAVMVQQEMAAAMSLRIPLVVDLSVGPCWLDTQPWSA